MTFNLAVAEKRAREAEVRIRLEGAWERLEAATASASKLAALLGDWRWRGGLLASPDLIASVLRERLAARDAAASVESWVRSHEPHGGPTHELLARHRASLALLTQAARGRARAGGEVPVDDALRTISGAVHLALVGAPRPDERRLLEGRTGSRLLPAVTFGSYPVAAALATQGWPALWIGAAVALTLAAAAAALSGAGSGGYVITTHRLIWQAWRGQPMQFELRDLSDDEVRLVGTGSIEIDSALGTVLIPLVARPDEFLKVLRAQRALVVGPEPQ